MASIKLWEYNGVPHHSSHLKMSKRTEEPLLRACLAIHI